MRISDCSSDVCSSDLGDSIVLEHSGHVLRSETSGAAAVNGCVIETIRGDRGFFTPEQLAQVLTPGNQYVPPTRLVCLEQTHNFAGGDRKSVVKGTGV